MDNKNELTVDDIIVGKMELLGFDPTDERECMKRVSENGYVISLVDPDTITDNMAMCAVMSAPFSIQYIPRGFITNSLMMAAICLEPKVAGFLAELELGNEDMYIEAVRRDWTVIQKLAAVATYDICMEAVMTCGLALQYVPVNFRDREMCYQAVFNDPEAIRYATTQDSEIAEMAVLADRDYLKFVINQTDDICLKALRFDGTALQYVRNKKPEYCAAALADTNDAAQYIPRSVMEEVVKIMNEEMKQERGK